MFAFIIQYAKLTHFILDTRIIRHIFEDDLSTVNILKIHCSRCVVIFFRYLKNLTVSPLLHRTTDTHTYNIFKWNQEHKTPTYWISHKGSLCRIKPYNIICLNTTRSESLPISRSIRALCDRFKDNFVTVVFFGCVKYFYLNVRIKFL